MERKCHATVAVWGQADTEEKYLKKKHLKSCNDITSLWNLKNKGLYLVYFQFFYGPGTFFGHKNSEKIFSDLAPFWKTWVS